MTCNLGHNKKRTNQTHQPSSLSRNNQVVPNNSSVQTNQDSIQTVNNLVPVSCYPEVPQRANMLPALPAPPRRRLISEMELANALSVLQQQQRCASRRPLYRRRRRSVVHRPKTPALSPIRESGLSNPASPSRQNCTVSAVSGTGIRPI
nr:uncharacterized protein LOC111510442 [Leptinotarsa decemlineata]